MADKITKDMTFAELLQKYPETAEILMKRGFHCIGCHMAATETIEQGAKAHGISDDDVDSMIKEMNELVEKK
ncbi:DUF1858 domain-containing protein [Nanoarchaeota archaeon]